MEALIRIEHVGLTFTNNGQSTEVLRDFSLDIPPGRFVAVLGPSGAGKSTLLRVVAGLLRPTTGRVVIAARRDNKHLPVALVFQDARLLPWRNAASNVAFGLEHGQFSASERRQKVGAALELVGLADLGARYPHELSGGQRQRVALARALAVDPDILLMDEPFAALDAITRESLQVELARIHAATGKTTLFVTHSIEEAVYLADQVVAVSGNPGRLAASIPITTTRPRSHAGPAIADMAARLRVELLPPPSA
jgi:NitT/TauT family transport system ATP-binding protein